MSSLKLPASFLLICLSWNSTVPKFEKNGSKNDTLRLLAFILQMIDVVKWCLELGVEHISVYAFSIDNFKRSKDEVAFLMQLAEDKYAELSKV